MPALCSFCTQGSLHPQFACLMSDRRVVHADTSYWDFSRQPAWNLLCHNRERCLRFGPKNTKAGAPYHQNTLVLAFKANAAVFVRVMRDKNRSLRHRMARGVALAARWHLIDPAQEGEPVRIFCAGDSEDDPVFKRYKRDALRSRVDRKSVV